MAINLFFKEQRIGIFYYFSEIRSRMLYILFSFCTTFFIAYGYSFELIYLFVRPFFAPKNFIFTDITEALTITLKICFIFSFFCVLPLFFYQIWCFIIPSFIEVERKKTRFFLFFCFFLLFFGSLITYFFILPEIFQFLCTFEIKKQILTVQLEARIISYVNFTFRVYGLFLLLFQIPLIISILILFNIFTPRHFCEFRKYYFFLSVLLAALVSPPDIWSQLCLALFFILLYEYSIWLGFLYEKNREHSL